MPVAVLFSRALSGMHAPLVTVEVHLANGLPSCTIVGLPEAEVRESRDRVRAALQNAGFEFPARRITINLAPADLPKESGRFDLPIAIGILAANGQIALPILSEYEFAGELSLTGECRAIRGALAMTYHAHQSGRTFILPSMNAAEAALVSAAKVLSAHNLISVVAHLRGEGALPATESNLTSENFIQYADLCEVKGQQHAKRALEIAAAGRHSLLLVGPPGTGKSMLAQRLPSILPPMTEIEAIESAAIQSLGSRGFDARYYKQRTVRTPHHTASAVALVGGGSDPRPGEISLAHHGVLFLDELPEFDRRVLEVLREPLESGKIIISRAARQSEFPAQFQLIAAMNPCPCGYHGHPTRACRCTPEQVSRYKNKLSGPLLDRIDMGLEVPCVPDTVLRKAADGEKSRAIQLRVSQAFTRQLQRQGKPNTLLSSNEIDLHCPLAVSAIPLIQQAMQKLHLSARAYHRILKLARTIADLAEQDELSTQHIAEAIQYRRMLNTN